MTRMPDERLPKQLLYGELCYGKRSVGGQKKRFKDRAGTNTPRDEYDTYREYRVANTIRIANPLFLRG